MDTINFKLFNKNIDSQLELKKWEMSKNKNLKDLDILLEGSIDSYLSDNHLKDNDISEEDKETLYKIHREAFESVKKMYPLLKMQDSLSRDDTKKFITEYKNKFQEFYNDEMLTLNAGPKMKIR